jgi:phage shock protein A
MGLLERLRQLIASNVNALFASLTDPGAAIDELIGNMEAAAREARQQVKAALVEDKRALRHLEAAERSIAEWAARAERAVQAGDDTLAKEALARKAELEAERAEIDSARRKGRGELDELERSLRDLDAKIAVVKSRRQTLKEVMRARARGGGAVDRYDEVVRNVETREAENELDQEIGNEALRSAEVKQKIEKLESERDADARLAALKDKMKK